MKSHGAWMVTLLCLSACASTHPDHFFVLEPLPAASKQPPPMFTTLATLKISVPSLVDRNEMVLRDGDAALVLEHERWAAPLTDQMATVLGQDLEQRRPDVLMSARRVSQAGGPTLAVSIEIVDLSVSRTDGVSIEARWRVEHAADKPTTGRDTFRHAVSGTNYGAFAHALSSTLAQLADRLILEFPAAPISQP